MIAQGKVWGLTREIYRAATFSAYHLSVNKFGFCSKHRHKRKYNLFYVLSGKLKITIWRGGIPDTTILGPGQTSRVPPDFFHQFEGLENTECIELYYVFLEEPDIERKNQGGIRK